MNKSGRTERSLYTCNLYSLIVLVLLPAILAHTKLPLGLAAWLPLSLGRARFVDPCSRCAFATVGLPCPPINILLLLPCPHTWVNGKGGKEDWGPGVDFMFASQII